MQECESGVNPQPKDDTMTIFVRRWCPAKLEFGKFQEITLDRKNHIHKHSKLRVLFPILCASAADTDIRYSLSQISGITMDKMSYMKVGHALLSLNYTIISCMYGEQ